MITLVNIMKPTTFNLIIAMSISGVPSIARIVRGQMLSVMRNEYVEAVRGMGASACASWSSMCCPTPSVR